MGVCMGGVGVCVCVYACGCGWGRRMCVGGGGV